MVKNLESNVIGLPPIKKTGAANDNFINGYDGKFFAEVMLLYYVGLTTLGVSFGAFYRVAQTFGIIPY